MLINDFYHITDLKKTEDSLRAEIRLNPFHAIYKGHFPKQAVVPGVMQIQIIKELLEAGLMKKFMIREVVVAKYLAPVTPKENTVLQIQIDFNRTEIGEYLINASVVKDDATFTKLKAKLSESVQ